MRAVGATLKYVIAENDIIALVCHGRRPGISGQGVHDSASKATGVQTAERITTVNYLILGDFVSHCLGLCSVFP
jgi:hypothetical protein